jgi:hypothetical protein
MPSAGVECVAPSRYARCPVVHVGGKVYPINGLAKSCGRMNGYDWPDMPGGRNSPVWWWEPILDGEGKPYTQADGTVIGQNRPEWPARDAAKALGCMF